jgi:hypothetical protein
VIDIVRTPGLKTTSQQDYARCSELRQHGYEWITFQAQNGGSTKDYDLGPAKAAGLEAGVWGVSYDAASFETDGKALAQQARKLGASHLIVDVEMAAKNTRDSRGLQPLIKGVRSGLWSGPVHLNTMGPPHTPSFNDYAIDLQSIAETGGGVFTQAYANETDSFAPEHAVTYWTRFVPREALNMTISLYPAEADKEHPGRRYDGAKWVELLQAAGWDRGISIFMSEAATDADLDALDAVTKVTVPPPTPVVDVAGNRNIMLERAAETIGYWRNVQNLDEDVLQRQRQTLAWRVLNVTQTGQNLRSIQAALDAAGAPRP